MQKYSSARFFLPDPPVVCDKETIVQMTAPPPSVRPKPETAGLVPDSDRKLVGNSAFAELDLHATGSDMPGLFGQLIQMPARHGGWIESARGTTHSGIFQFSMKVRGPFEQMERLRIYAESHPLFPKVRPSFTINRDLGESIKCRRKELFIEAEDDPQIAMVSVLAGKNGIGIASMEMRRVDAAFSGEYVTAQIRLATEMMLDVKHDQATQFSHFKGDLVELMDYDRLIRIWGPLSEDQSGERPWWKSNHRKIWR